MNQGTYNIRGEKPPSEINSLSRARSNPPLHQPFNCNSDIACRACQIHSKNSVEFLLFYAKIEYTTSTPINKYNVTCRLY